MNNQIKIDLSDFAPLTPEQKAAFSQTQTALQQLNERLVLASMMPAALMGNAYTNAQPEPALTAASLAAAWAELKAKYEPRFVEPLYYRANKYVPLTVKDGKPGYFLVSKRLILVHPDHVDRLLQMARAYRIDLRELPDGEYAAMQTIVPFPFREDPPNDHTQKE